MRAIPIGCVLTLALSLGAAQAARPVLGPGAHTIATASKGGAHPSGPPASLKCKPPDRPRQIWDCSPTPCTAHLVWRCELWCKPGHYPTLGDVRANGGKAECVKHGR